MSLISKEASLFHILAAFNLTIGLPDCSEIVFLNESEVQVTTSSPKLSKWLPLPLKSIHVDIISLPLKSNVFPSESSPWGLDPSNQMFKWLCSPEVSVAVLKYSSVAK